MNICTVEQLDFPFISLANKISGAVISISQTIHQRIPSTLLYTNNLAVNVQSVWLVYKQDRDFDQNRLKQTITIIAFECLNDSDLYRAVSIEQYETSDITLTYIFIVPQEYKNGILLQGSVVVFSETNLFISLSLSICLVYVTFTLL